jgi:hypothetical protein
MTPDTSSMPERSYGCTFGCGNPYDFILVTVSDGTTEFVCLPCFIKLATDMLSAVMEADNPNVQAAVQWASANGADSAPGPGGRSRGRNAPATADDPDVFAAYDGVISVDDLPDEFR